MNKSAVALYIAVALVIVFLGSLIPNPSGNIWYSQYLNLLVMIFIGFGLVLWNYNKLLSGISFYLIFSVFIVSNCSPRSVFNLFLFDIGLTISYIISRLDSKLRKRILYSLGIIVFLQTAMVFLQFLKLDPVFKPVNMSTPDYFRWVGFMGSAGQSSALISILLLPVSFISIWFSILSIFVLLMSKSTVAFLGATIASFLMIISSGKRNLIIASILCMAIFTGVFLLKVDKINSFEGKHTLLARIDVWKYAIKNTLSGKVQIEIKDTKKEVRCNRWFGYGFGNWMSIFPYIPSQGNFNWKYEKFTHAHNDFIEWFFETGIVGGLLLLLLLGKFFIDFFLSRKSTELWYYFCGMIAYFINASGNFVSQLSLLAIIGCVIYGLYEGTRRELNGKNSSLA